MNDARAPESPRQRYAAELARHGYERDPAQEKAVAALDQLQARLLAAPHPSLWRRLLGQPAPAVKGLYLWGGVGRGKTWLMDCFYDTLPFRDKVRLHFHRFMHEVHATLKQLPGEQDPLAKVAERFRARGRVICFDEFFVSDITDAMLLGRLFQHLFARGVTLVATSNVQPDELYRNGLQRERFLPAIDLLEQHCEVLELASSRDWRLRALTRAPVYLTPDDAHAETALARLFAELAQGTVEDDAELTINGRSFRARRVCAQAAWFDFAALCDGPYGSADYIELARTYPAILVSGLPQFTPFNEDAAQRFVHLIDEMYDRRVKLAVTAQAPVVELYDGKRLRGEFARVESRLIEMQSREYLAEAHRASCDHP
ncbi:MAG TPA: cell division protein ZapE [Rhodanobacter sp.]